MWTPIYYITKAGQLCPHDYAAPLFTQANLLGLIMRFGTQRWRSAASVAWILMEDLLPKPFGYNKILYTLKQLLWKNLFCVHLYTHVYNPFCTTQKSHRNQGAMMMHIWHWGTTHINTSIFKLIHFLSVHFTSDRTICLVSMWGQPLSENPFNIMYLPYALCMLQVTVWSMCCNLPQQVCIHVLQDLL